MTLAKLRSVVLSLGMVVAATACGNGDRAFVGYTFFEDPGFAPELLVLEFSDGRQGRRLTGGNFGDRTGNRWDTPEFETQTTGELVASFWLVQGADTLSSGELRIDLRPNWRWNISFFREAADPSATCFGCVGAAAYEVAAVLQTVPADSLWLVWGGNTLSNPAVF